MSGSIRCPTTCLTETLRHLRDGGTRRIEVVVLWLGVKVNGQGQVREAYRPDQIAEVDLFRIPPESMRALMSHLRQGRLQILAQVHSHPELAFHSRTDNEWAIVRHEGALSLVIPHFASHTTPENFLEEVVTYQLDSSDTWVEVRSRDAVGLA